MHIEVKRPDEQEIEDLGVLGWPIWECRPSTFDWHYDQKEICYVLAGKVTVSYEGGEVSIEKGDLVTFPKGLDCVWNVSEAVRKRYKFD